MRFRILALSLSTLLALCTPAVLAQRGGDTGSPFPSMILRPR
jgi:hypothetical protein